MLPYVVHDIVRHGSDSHVDVLSRQIGAFFAKHCTTTETQSSLHGLSYLSFTVVYCPFHSVLHLIILNVAEAV